MKQQVSPKLVLTVIVIGVALLGLIGYRVWKAPSVVPGAEVAEAAIGANAGGARKQAGLAGGGGPPAEALRFRDQYNQTHPDAQGSR
jgi:hypothetical protein